MNDVPQLRPVHKLQTTFASIVMALCVVGVGPARAFDPEPAARPVVTPLRWEEVQPFPLLGTADLPGELAERLVDLPLFVLLPADPALLDSAIVTTGELWYAASIPLHGVTIYLRGSRQAFVVEDLEIDGEAWDRGYLLTRNEQIVSASFIAFGTGYLVEVECADPAGDPRCTRDDFILSLTGSLALVVNEVLEQHLATHETPGPIEGSVPDGTVEPANCYSCEGGAP